MLGSKGLQMQDSMRLMEKLRVRLESIRDSVEQVISDYAIPKVTVGPRRKLFMSQLVDNIASVRPTSLSHHMHSVA